MDNLEAFRQFYLQYPALISETVSRKSGALSLCETKARNEMTNDEVTAKAKRLAAYSSAANADEMTLAIERLFSLSYINKVGPLLT